MSLPDDRSIGIYYEHPEWFVPLFDEMERRGVPFEAIDARSAWFDPSEPPRHTLLLNRMSPSAYLRDAGEAIFHTAQYLSHAEQSGVRVINGWRAWQVEISKAYQLSLLERLGLPYPRARVVHDPTHLVQAAAGLRFPVVVKPNIGGSGAGVRRFDSVEELRAAASGIDLGLDHTGLVQEFIPPRDGRIVRVEVLDGAFLYAIRILTDGSDFNLCPADVCLDVDDPSFDGAACPASLKEGEERVERVQPAPGVVSDVERILAEAGARIGGVEYVVDDRDGRLYYYDVNALSNFVADAPRIVGFDPFVNLVDWLEREAGLVPAAVGGPPGTAA